MAVVVALCLVASSAAPPSAQAATPGLLYIELTPRPNGGLAVVGDSLLFTLFHDLDDSLRLQQWGPIGLEVRSGRRTVVSQEFATSGIDAVRRLRAWGLDPPIWVIALGTNDMTYTYGNIAAADALIDTMMAEIGPQRRVVWVNVFALSASTRAQAVEFNSRLTAAAAHHPLLSIADWYSLASIHLDWFVDDVHTNLTGSVVRNEFVAEAALIPRCPLATPPTVLADSPLHVVAATATAVATRRCRV